jgi:hypothetical protein
MHRLKLLLLPFAALAEAACLVLCWILALLSPRKAARAADWAERLFPDPGWYTKCEGSGHREPNANSQGAPPHE